MISVTQWLDFCRRRGVTIPHLARYCLMTLSEALGIPVVADHPAVRAASAVRRVKLPRTAPPIPFSLIELFEEIAVSENNPMVNGWPRRYFYS